MTLLLFDIDGTLVSTGGAGVRALNRAFQELFAIENAMKDITPHGKTDPAIIREIFSACSRTQEVVDCMEDIYAAYVRYLREEVANSNAYKVLPGIDEILAECSASAGIMLGLATGNIELGARIKLERGNLNRYFRSGGFGSDAADRTDLVRRAATKVAAEYQISAHPETIFVIGDTPLDVKAGRQAGFRTVGVATSKYSLSELREAGADLAITDFVTGRDQFLRLTRMV